MSYDINFWRYEPGISLDHQQVYEQLSDGKRIEGLEDLPIREMLARLEAQFADWERLGERNFDGGNRGAFEISTTPPFLTSGLLRNVWRRHESDYRHRQ